MSSIASFYRANPGLLAMTLLIGVDGGTLLFLAILMRSTGAQLRPLVWFAMLFALFLVPQIIRYVVCARRPIAAAGTLQEDDARHFYFDPNGRLSRIWHSRWARAAGFLVLLSVVVTWFFRGAAWAMSIPAAEHAQPLPASVLQEQLLGVNEAQLPITVNHLNAGEFEVCWRYADRRWLEHARANPGVPFHRLRLRLDEERRAVQVTEYLAADGAGSPPRWRAQTGLRFFEQDPAGRLTQPQESKIAVGNVASNRTRFGSEDLGAPFLQIVTAGGWTWRPVVWEAPNWIAWLVE